MTLYHLPCGKGDCPGLLQQGIQSYQNAWLNNCGRFLDLNDIPILQSLDKISLRVSIGLTTTLRIFIPSGQSTYLLCYTIQHNAHTILRCGSRILYARQCLIYPRRIVVHIIQIGKVHHLGHISIIDAAHTRQNCFFVIQLGVSGRTRIRVRKYLTDEVKYLCACRAGVCHIRKPQPCGNRLCAHGLSGSSRPSKEKIPHLCRFPGSGLSMFTDINDLLWNDVPFRKHRYQLFFLTAHSPWMQFVLADKIRVFHNGVCAFHNNPRCFCENRKFPRNHMGRLKSAGIQLHLRYTHQISGLVHTHLDGCCTGGIFDASVGVIT